MMDLRTKVTPAWRKLWQILNRAERREAIMLLGLSLIGMVMETLGVGLVIPALALMSQGDIAAHYPPVRPLLRAMGYPTHTHLVVAGMLVLVAVYVIKAMFLGFLTWRQMRFVYGVQAELSERLFTGYLRQPYTFHLQRNSAQLIRNALNETNLLSQTVLSAASAFLTEVSVLVGILILMLIIEPVGTVVVVSIVGAASWAFNRFTEERISRWGVARQLHEGQRIQHLQQGLGGAKEVKILGREEDFLEEFRKHSVGFARVGERQATLGQLPRLWLEVLAVTGLAGLVLAMIWQGKPLESLLPTLGLFAAAAFRLMPSANRVIGASQNVRFALPVIGVLHSELAAMQRTEARRRGEPLPFRNALSLDAVTYRYPGTDTPVLRGLTLEIPRGGSVGFIGTTGSGKSTLVDVILGLLTPESGVVLVDGVDIQTNQRGWQDQIGYVPQSIFLTDDTLRRNVAFGLSNEEIDDQAVWRAMRAAQLELFVNDLPAGLETVVGERGVRLSGGQRQRIGIARALYHDPLVLVLDEATSSLDSVTEREIVETVRALRGDKTLIIVAHRLSTVEHCDHLFRIEQGRVVEEGSAACVLKGPGSRVG